MSKSNTPAKLRRTRVAHRPASEILATIGKICQAGATCAEVQGSRVAKQALSRLSAALSTANGTQRQKASLLAALATTTKTLHVDYTVAATALRSYETTVGAISGGDPAVLGEAGLVSIDDLPETLPIPRKVTGVRGRPGKRAKETRLSWDAARGAEGYAVQTWTGALDDPNGVWSDVGVGDRRAYRTVTAGTPGVRFYVRVAAIDRAKATMEWSESRPRHRVLTPAGVLPCAGDGEDVTGLDEQPVPVVIARSRHRPLSRPPVTASSRT